MLNVLEFEKAKVKQGIKVSGKLYEFSRADENDYGESTDAIVKTTVAGIFNESVESVTLTNKESGVTIASKPNASILIAAEDRDKIRNGDYVIINSKRYDATTITDINNLGLAFKVGLELIVNGNAAV